MYTLKSFNRKTNPGWSSKTAGDKGRLKVFSLQANPLIAGSHCFTLLPLPHDKHIQSYQLCSAFVYCFSHYIVQIGADRNGITQRAYR